MKYSDAFLTDAHKHSIAHREAVLASAICGCFHCRGTFAPEEIAEWTDGTATALCPKCGIDSVIGDSSALPVADFDFRNAMRRRWFKNS